jgi:spoIIIJ-associated protein
VTTSQVEKTASSVEEALEAALEELGASEQEVDVEIVQEPKGGFLGLGSQEATVVVRLKKAAGPDLTEEELDEQADVAADFLEDLLEHMDIDADVETQFVDGTMYVEIWGVEGGEDEMGILIGHHGQGLESLQELARVLITRKTGNRCRIVVDIEDYQKRRRSGLVSRVREMAGRVQKTGKSEELEPMNPFERKMVHDAVSSVGGVETISEGEEPDRRVVIRKSR